MNATAQQTNYGLTVLHDKPCGGQATILATGVGRSGTTMLARVMTGIGLKMTKNLSPRTGEDKLIGQFVKEDNLAGLEQLCREYDGKFKKWGFKAPGLRRDLAKFAAVMRQPRFVIVTRDPVAVGIRNQSSSNRKMLAEISEAAQATAALLQQLGAMKYPTLLVSYEKALQYPEIAVKAVAEFCGIAVDEAGARKIAAETVINGDKRFFDNPANKAAPPPLPLPVRAAAPPPPMPRPVAAPGPRPAFVPPPVRPAAAPPPARPLPPAAARPAAPPPRAAVPPPPRPVAPGPVQPVKRG